MTAPRATSALALFELAAERVGHDIDCPVARDENKNYDPEDVGCICTRERRLLRLCARMAEEYADAARDWTPIKIALNAAARVLEEYHG